MKDTDLVTVCDGCLKASCWQGAFYCEEYKDAGTTEMTVADLRVLGYESPSYWDTGTGIPDAPVRFVRHERRTPLTDRQIFAATAMEGIISNSGNLYPVVEVAHLSVQYADALIKALETPSPETTETHNA